MTFSFACPHCGKNYRKIKSKLAGRKAQCTCGKVIRLGSKSQKQDRDSQKPDKENKSETRSSQSSRSKSTNTSQRSSKPHRSPKRQSTSETQVKTEPRRKEQERKQERNQERKRDRVPMVSVDQVDQSKPSLVVDDHYGDLDSILAADSFSEDFSAPSNHPSEAVAVPEGLILPKEKKPTSTAWSTIGFLAVIGSATLAFWFALLIVLLRFGLIDHFLLQNFVTTLGQINTGEPGIEEISNNLSYGFIAVGWGMWTIALLMIPVAVTQFINGVAHLFLRRSIVSWADGIMATLAIAFVFLVLGSLFMHTTRMNELNRELDSLAAPAEVGEFRLDNVERVRTEYNQRTRNYLMVMLATGMIPFTIFGLSMIRLLASTDEEVEVEKSKIHPVGR